MTLKLLSKIEKLNQFSPRETMITSPMSANTTTIRDEKTKKNGDSRFGQNVYQSHRVRNRNMAINDQRRQKILQVMKSMDSKP